jgi:hypothetical protein
LLSTKPNHSKAFAVVGVVSLVGLVAACGSSSKATTASTTKGSSGSATSAPTGKPIILFTDAATQYNPGVGAGAKAAAKAINAAGGVKDPSGGPNRPISIVVCDDTSGSNATAACGQEAVSDHALAVVGDETAYGSVFDPIVTSAGIPIIAQGAYAPADLSSPLSFPITNPQASGVAVGELAVALGQKKLFQISLNIPSYFPGLSYDKQEDAMFGVDVVGKSLITATATASPDLTPIAAAAATSGAGVIFMNVGPQGITVMKEMLAQGVSFQKTAVVADSNVISVQNLASILGSSDNGIYFIGNAYPSTDTAIPAVKQFDDEMDTYGDTTSARNEGTEQAWEGVHIVANLLATVPTISSAALVTAMEHAGTITPGITPPFNWSKHAYSSGYLAQFRIFTNTAVISRVINGQQVPISNGFVSIDQPFQITNPAGKLSG